MNANVQDDLLGLPEAARRYDTSERSIRRLAHAGVITLYRRPGIKGISVSASELAAALKPRPYRPKSWGDPVVTA